MRGVLINGYDTANLWGLIMNQKIISQPEPKTNYVQVPGRDGDIDMTQALTGLVNYNPRTAEFLFLLMDGSHEDREELLGEIIGKLHGQQVTIVDEDDHPGYYMTGRLKVTGTENNGAYGQIAMEVICDPWRYALDEREISTIITGGNITKTIRLENGGYRTICPTVTVSGAVTLNYTGFDTGTSVTKNLTAGSYELSDLMLPPGMTTVTASGSGTITFTYREAVF